VERLRNLEGGLDFRYIFVMSVASPSLSLVLSSRNITIYGHELILSDLAVISSGTSSRSLTLVCVCSAKLGMFDPALIFSVGAHFVTTREETIGRLVMASTLTTLVSGMSGHLWKPCFGTNELAVQLLDSVG
jgi:hypothetical protein